jgi:hypothetical protein
MTLTKGNQLIGRRRCSTISIRMLKAPFQAGIQVRNPMNLVAKA